MKNIFCIFSFASEKPVTGSFFRMHEKKRQPKLIVSFLSFFKN